MSGQRSGACDACGQIDEHSSLCPIEALEAKVERLRDPDEHLLDVAVAAALSQVREGEGWSREVAIQNPKNRDSIRLALQAVATELSREDHDA